MRLLLILLCAVAAVTVPVDLFAGAWTQDEGGYYVKLTANSLSTTRERDTDGNEADLFSEQEELRDGKFVDVNFSVYAEYGLFRHLTLIGSIPFKYLRSERTEFEIINNEVSSNGTLLEESTVGVGDLKAGLRYDLRTLPLFSLLGERTPLALEGGVKIPFGYEEAPPDGGPPLGNGDVDSDISILLGRSLWPLPLYFTGNYGFRNRGGDFHDEVFFGGEVGYSKGKWLLKVSVDGVENRIDDAELKRDEDSFETVVGDQDFLHLTPGFAYEVGPDTYFTADLIEVISGKQTLEGRTFSIGVAYTR